MPRRRRHDEISGYHLDRIERQASQLDRAMGEAELALTPLGVRYNALGELRDAIRRTLNILKGWPADYERPHERPMSGGIHRPPPIVVRQDGGDDAEPGDG